MDLVCRNLFIDTQYLILKSFDFESKELISLADLAKSGFINVYITDITNKEIYKKIKDLVNLAYEKINLSDARVLRSIPAFRDLLNVYDKKNAVTKIQTAYEKFKIACHVRVVSSAKISVMDVFESYCLEQPPFNGNNKKNEFPDAFALMAIVK